MATIYFFLNLSHCSLDPRLVLVIRAYDASEHHDSSMPYAVLLYDLNWWLVNSAGILGRKNIFSLWVSRGFKGFKHNSCSLASFLLEDLHLFILFL